MTYILSRIIYGNEYTKHLLEGFYIFVLMLIFHKKLFLTQTPAIEILYAVLSGLFYLYISQLPNSNEDKSTSPWSHSFLGLSPSFLFSDRNRAHITTCTFPCSLPPVLRVYSCMPHPWSVKNGNRLITSTAASHLFQIKPLW